MKISIEDDYTSSDEFAGEGIRVLTIETPSVVCVEVLRDFRDLLLGFGFQPASVNSAFDEISEEYQPNHN